MTARASFVAVIALATGVLASTAAPARADGYSGAGDDLLAATFATMDVATVATFAAIDATGRSRGYTYGSVELGLDFAPLRVTRDALLAKDGDPRWLIPALAHTALVVHGTEQLAIRGRWSTTSTVLLCGLTASSAWFIDDATQGEWPPARTRTIGFGVAKAAVNESLAAGFVYQTVREADDGHYGHAAAAAAGALYASTLGAEGISLARGRWLRRGLHPHRPRATVVDDGAHLGVGLAAAGHW